jgi:hypothetical protein
MPFEAFRNTALGSYNPLYSYDLPAAWSPDFEQLHGLILYVAPALLFLLNLMVVLRSFRGTTGTNI